MVFYFLKNKNFKIKSLLIKNMSNLSKKSTRFKLYVTKRDGSLVPVRYDEITDRLTSLADMYPPLSDEVNTFELTRTIIERIKDGITTSFIDNFAAEICASNLSHPDYEKLASRLVASSHQKNVACQTGISFKNVAERLYNNYDIQKNHCPVINETIYEASKLDEINDMIDLSRDFLIDFFGYRTLLNSYLLKVQSPSKNDIMSTVLETPQHMFMRVAIAIHYDKDNKDLSKIKETYDAMSLKYFTHASPTLFNAGTPRQQLFSCFLLTMKDSIDGIFKCVSDTAKISKYAGGIGIAISDVRARGSYIKGTAGRSDGLLPMLKVLNDTARYVNQGGRRKGSFAVYLELFHPDIFEFLEAKLPHGAQEQRAHDLFYALWISDIFMSRVKNNEMWSLMCPDECPGLTECYGPEFEKLYTSYEKEGRYRRQVPASEIWAAIITSQIETGTPYMLYKDACNMKSNQKNLGTIKCSNLCAEILEYNTDKKYACCVLASVVLSTYVSENKEFDYKKLYDVVRIITRNLDMSIDKNYYPVPETEVSNFSERPLGIGVQGLADAFFKMRIAYDSQEARSVNKKIFETIYFAALTESCLLAKEKEKYKSYEGSPASQNILQMDLWSMPEFESMWDWAELRKNIKEHGLRNSLLTACMPTASTAQIMGSTEAFEPITSNVYTRRVLAGEYTLVNNYLTDDLIRLGLWSPKMKNELIRNKGSVQNIPEIPDELKKIYKTVWELPQRVLIDLSADRGPFVDQTQSLNLFFEEPTYEKLTKAHFYGFAKGLKTGSYYIRSKPSSNAEQFTVVDKVPEITAKIASGDGKEPEVCDMCSG
jgi:ribonucleoside-diphosphate reductase alpha subunit